MKSKFLLLVAVMLSPVLLSPGAAFAQSDDERCPQLPADGGLSWQSSDGPDFLYCKAMAADGTQAFAVMLREDSDFRGDRNLRDDAAVIDGHKVRWYRGDLAMPTNILVRETLLELGRNSTAHIVVRARSEEQLAEHRQLAEGLRFSGSDVGGD